MTAIDDKVVAMSFESSKFESGVNSTLTALDKLKAALHFPNAGKGLEDVGKAAKQIDLSHIGRGVDAIREKLSYFSVAALAIFANVAMKAVQTGATIVKSFTLEPLIAGYKEYATNLNSIQTILANTEASGATLKDVNAALDELNRYSDKTIYNFSQMARNIGTFTAAGVELKVATGSIKGIANLAALSGSSAEQASTAMYQLSQAISAGSVKLMDWNSVVNAGMGGTVFQRALAQTAEAMGTLKKGTVELTGPMKNVTIAGKSFRNSLAAEGKDSWLTSKVLTQTLKQFTGDLKDAELAAMGFNAQQIKAIQQTAKTATFAATEVKTLTQVLDVAKETAASGWAQTWRIIFGDFVEAKTTFTALSNTINGFINKSAEARNKVLQDWKDLGGRTVLIESIQTAFHNLGMVLAPIKKAFRDIFPAKTGSDLMYLTQQFEAFVAKLKPSVETMKNLRRTFRGIFAIFSIGIQVVKGIFTVLGELFGAVGGGSGGFLSLTASIGDFFVAIDKALKKGDRLNDFFESLGKLLAKPLTLLSEIAGAIADLFSGFSPGGISGGIDGITTAMTPLEAVIEGVSEAWNNLIDSFDDAIDMTSVLESVGKAISGIGVAIGDILSNMNFEAILQVIRTGLFAGLVLMFKQFLGKGSFLDQISTGFGQGIIGNISSSFNSLSGTMKGMQSNLRAKTLKEIAIAIALLAASLLMISLIDPEKLNGALGAMTIMFAELIAAMALLDKAVKSPGFLKLPFIAGSLILLAIAIDLLTISVMALSRLSWEELSKGLAGVGGLLVAISAASKALSSSSAGLVRAGIGIIGIAIAIKILGSAMEDFGAMKWEEIGKGLVSVGVGLAVIAAAAKVMPTGMVVMGAGLIAIAIALKILADAVLKFGTMKWETMGKGLAGVAGGLFAIAAAMQLMPKTVALQAAGLLLVALSLGMIADAVIKMGGMSIREIAKGLGTLAGSLVILAAALHLMSGTFAGAAALTVAAAGIAMLAPALTKLGKQSWSEILKGLITLAGALTLLGVAGYLVGPVVPALLGLGVAMVLLGGGLALAGAGIFLIAAGISTLAVAGPAALGIMIAALNELMLAIPEIAKNFILGLLEIVEAFAATAPKFVDSMIEIIASLLDVIIQSAPKFGEAFTAILLVALKVIDENKEKVIQAGFELLIALLQGIKDNIVQVTTMVVSIIVTFLQTLSANLGKLVTAGAQVLVSFLKGIANNLAKVVTAVFDIVVKFLEAIATNYPKIIAAGLNILVKLIEGISKNLNKIVIAAGDAVVSFITGVGKKVKDIIDAGVNIVLKLIQGIGKNAVELADAAGKVIVDFLRGLRIAIETYSPQIRTESLKLGYAIIDGMTFGLASKAESLYSKAREIASKVLGIFKKIPLINSPSKATTEVGASLVEGLVLGLDRNAQSAYSSAIALSNGVINAFNQTFQTNSPSKVMIEIGKFVGQGFAQGLRGSTEDVRAAFAEMNEKLTDAMTTARETIISEQEKLDKLRAEKKPDTEAIRKSQQIIDENEALLKRSTETRQALIVQLRDEKKELVGLTNEYEKISEKIKLAQDALAQAQQTRRDALTSYTSQYSTLPDIPTTDADGNPIDQLKAYMDALANQTKAVATYKQTLDELRKLGLDDATYKKLLEEGTADQSFANQLLAGGKTAVQSLNKLDAQLMKVSATLATNAADNLYKAGVDAAQGLLNGLTSRNKKIRDAMDELIEDIVSTIRRKLQIKSPSQVFQEIGAYAMEGLARGFSKSSKVVTGAIEDAADDAIFAMKSSVRRIADMMADELNPSPVITPILDLARVRTQSEELAALTKVTPITAAASYGQAAIISSSQSPTQTEEIPVIPGGTTVKFEQNNYSPESLSEIEIYRQTRNQLSQLKSVLVTT